ncbi:MAG: pantetheine-phosphate adenylyltransferase [bacterium]
MTDCRWPATGDRPAPRVRVAVYPGSFDPITRGHLDVVHRATRLFDRVIVAVARRREKNPIFSSRERVALAREVLRDLPGVEVKAFSNLLVEFVEAQGACAVIRGMRAVMDFDYEFQMALTNRKLAPQVETVLFVPSERYFYLSSSLVRELARMNGKLDCFVPEPVERALRRKCGRAR